MLSSEGGIATRLPGAVIRILPDDHDFHVIERRRVESGKNIFRRWINGFAGAQFVAQEGGEFLHLRAREVIPDARFPRRFEFEFLVAHAACARLRKCCDTRI